ncbi:MAG: carboxypeptidase-like regulatory domain-containing protein, partial [Candidatus Thermoplasmatota archaeon]|nr:carboxypeptidase-like regulatory domain-containing protein [Candidatus Thermoplasmatota archaeon]
TVASNGVIHIMWHLKVEVVDQNGIPMEGASIEVKDVSGKAITGVTDPEGIVSLDVTEYVWRNPQQNIICNPYEITAAKDGYTGASTTLEITSNTETTLSIAKFTSPVDGGSRGMPQISAKSFRHPFTLGSRLLTTR